MHTPARRFNNRGISEVIAALLLIVTVVALTIVVYVFSVGMLGGGFQTTGVTGLQVTILPSIYSRDANIAVLNDKANFTVAVSSSLSSTQRVVVYVIAGRSVVGNVTVFLSAGESKTQFISQILNSTGIWTIKATAGGATIGSYSFDVRSTRDEADYAIQQWREQRFYQYLALGSFGFAILSLIVSVVSLARRRR